jgi:hypothetical protein
MICQGLTALTESYSRFPLVVFLVGIKEPADSGGIDVLRYLAGFSRLAM